MLDELAAAMRDAVEGADLAPHREHIEKLMAALIAEEPESKADPVALAAEALLVCEPARWAHELRPRWIALEQVPPALPLWRAMAHALEGLGYRAWCGILNAADYGVPQTRRRAFLIASLDRVPHPPTPTHARDPQPGLFGESLPWVSMAEALGWVQPDDEWRVNGTESPRSRSTPRRGDEPAPAFAPGHTRPRMVRQVGFPRLDDRGDSPDGYRERDWRDETEPAVVTEKARSWVVRTGANTMKHSRDPDEVVPYERSCDEPAPTLDGKAGSAWVVNTGRDWKPGGSRDNAQKIPITDPAPAIDGKGRWFLERPATTIQGDPRVWPPGHKVNADDVDRLGEEEAAERYGDRAGSDALRITIGDALVLQSFPRDYPLAGNRSSQFEQVGNAVPPLLAAHVLGAVT